jgi:hypothetical protein
VNAARAWFGRGRPTGRAPGRIAPVELPAATPSMATEPKTTTARVGIRVLVVLIGVLLAVVIAAPIALSSQDLVAWAGAPDGLSLVWPWDVGTFLALDAAAAVCVGMVVYAAWRGEPGGAFGLLVWAFAGASAYANYRHGTRPGAADDAVWFFPAMSVAGPALLEVTVRRIRRWVQTSAGRYEHPLPHFRLARWLVALPETAAAWRLAVTEGYSRPEDAIAAARTLRGVAVPATGDTTVGASPDTAAGPSRDTATTTAPATPAATADTTAGGASTRRTQRRPLPGAATRRLERAWGDGLDPATGRPWTSRPLAAAAGVHHATAATHLRQRRSQPSQGTEPSSDRPAATALHPALPVIDPTRPVANPVTDPA